MSVMERLQQMGITLPPVPAPIAAYVPAVRTGNLIFVSGQLPRRAGEMLHPGRLGQNVSVDEGQAAARQAAMNALAVMRDALDGDLERVVKIVRVGGYVAATAEFVEHSRVVDGASSFFQEVFGDAGRHTRIAVGMASLPMGAAVEIDVVVEVA